MERRRDSLEVDRIYFETDSELYLVTPDGVGCFWYDTLEEAQEQHGDTGPVMIFEKLED